MTYVAIVLVTSILIVLMYVESVRNINRDLKKKEKELQSQIIKEKINSNIKEFQVKQKADKELIKQSIEKDKDVSKTNSINTSVGSHSLSF